MGKKKRLRRERQEAELAEVEAGSTGEPGFQLKMDRAGLHLHNLELAVKEWLESHSDLVQEETETETGDDVLYVDAPAVPPADAVSLIAADCIHNLRSSLDQLVFALSWAYTAGPLPKEVVEGCEFPIYGPRAPKARELRKRIGAVHPDAHSIIETFSRITLAMPLPARNCGSWISSGTWTSIERSPLRSSASRRSR